MNDVILLGLLFLTVYRVTRFVTHDALTRRLRERLQNRFEQRWIDKQAAEERTMLAADPQWHSLGAYFLQCPWCVSMWTGAPVVAAAYYTVGVPYPVLTWAAASAAAGILSRGDD